MQIDPTSHRKQDIFVSKSLIYFEDKYSFAEIREHGDNFAEITPGQSWTEPFEEDDPKLSTIYFRANFKYRVYSLDPYKILDLLGDMGGLIEFFLAIGFGLTFHFVKGSYERSLIGETYQI